MTPWMTDRLNTLRTANQTERPALRIPSPQPPPRSVREQAQPQPARGVVIVDLTIS
jgi:hypothetical protein